jgi:hypothetical protein
MGKHLHVAAAGQERTLGAEQSLTFGRSERCTLCLRPRDEGISRWAGSLQCESGTWWLANESDSRPFDVVDDLGFSHPIAPGARFAIDRGTVEIVLTGVIHRYCVTVTHAGEPERAVGHWTPTGSVTVGPHEVLITERERLALVAVFAGYLEPFPARTNLPSTYRRAGDRLGVPADTVRKRVEHVRAKLTEAGVPDLWGPHALEHLAKWLKVTGVIAADDLRLLVRR